MHSYFCMYRRKFKRGTGLIKHMKLVSSLGGSLYVRKRLKISAPAAPLLRVMHPPKFRKKSHLPPCWGPRFSRIGATSFPPREPGVLSAIRGMIVSFLSVVSENLKFRGRKPLPKAFWSKSKDDGPRRPEETSSGESPTSRLGYPAGFFQSP